MICTLSAGRGQSHHGSTGDSWEAKDVFNPAAIVRDGHESIFSIAPKIFPGRDSGTARVELGWLRAKTGCTLRAMPGHCVAERGLRAARRVRRSARSKAEGRYWLTYTGYDGANARLCLASSADLKTWEKHGVLFPELEWSKSGAILDVPIDGQYDALAIRTCGWPFDRPACAGS